MTQAVMAAIDLTQITIDQLDQIDNMADLKEWTKDCTSCGLRQQATEPVHSSGPFDSPILVTGMNPGFVEDGCGSPFAGRAELQESRCVSCQNYTKCYNWQTGQGAYRPLVDKCLGYNPQAPNTPDHIVPNKVKAGPYEVGGVISAGQLLDDLLVKLGIDRKKIFVTNSALCKSAAGEPSPQFVNRCASIRLRTEEILKPKVVVALGNLALGQYTGKKSTMKHVHGIPQKMVGPDRDSRILVPTYHPSVILRTMLAISKSSLSEQQAASVEITNYKIAMFDDLTTAFNLLSTKQLSTLILPDKQLVDGKLPIRIK